MTASEQLARIAALKPPPLVKIVLLDRGYSVWGWLCPKHKARKVLQGWEVKAEKDPPHEITCDDRSVGGCAL